MTNVRSKQVQLPPFEEDAAKSLGRLRAALASAISGIPGTIRRPSDLGRRLSLDPKLSWRLYNMARASDPIVMGAHVPGPANIRSFVAAAAKAGVRDDLLRSVESAAEEFEGLVRVHAGDRSAFDSMITSLAGSKHTAQTNLSQRRAAFRANRHIWGVEAVHRVNCTILNLGDSPDTINAAVVDGYLGLRHFRASAPLVIACTRVSDDNENPLPIRAQPLVPNVESNQGIALLPRFCSEPTPEFRVVPAENGFVVGTLLSRGIGNSGAIECYTGWSLMGAVSRYRSAGDEWGGAGATVHLPCEHITVCMLVRRGLFASSNPRLTVYGDQIGALPYSSRAYPLQDVLLPDETAACLGTGAAVLATPEIPKLVEVIQYALDRLAWNGDEFEAYHVRLAYPILSTTVTLHLELLERPADTPPPPAP